MAASLIVEEEHGTYAGSPHPHNGYYAGDFSGHDGLGSFTSVPTLTWSQFS